MTPSASPTRRDVLRRSVAALVTGGALLSATPGSTAGSSSASPAAPAPKPAAGADDPPAAPPRVPVVDTHVHCFAGPGDARFPYHDKAPYRPDKPATPEDLLTLMDAAGVDHAVIVHPEPYQDDHRYLEHCLTVGKGRLKGTCLFFSEKDGWERDLPALAKRTPLVAVRIHAYVQERLPPFDRPDRIRAYWKAAAGLGLAVQIHFEPRWAAKFTPFLKEFPDTPVLVDHLGRPMQGTGEEWAEVLRWADRPNVHVKLSALPVKSNYPHRDPAGPVGKLLAAYGAKRLIYGGGFEAASVGKPDPYRAARQRVIDAVREADPKVSDADLAAILGGNAAKLMGFGK